MSQALLVDSAACVTMLAGFGFSLSLIVAIGAQNAFVLQQGLRREHILAVAHDCCARCPPVLAPGRFWMG